MADNGYEQNESSSSPTRFVLHNGIRWWMYKQLLQSITNTECYTFERRKYMWMDAQISRNQLF